MNKHTDVTPDGGQVQSVVPPNDRVDKLYEASDRHPDDVGASANVPCLDMQRERDEDEEETKERKHGEKRICRIDIHVHGGEERREKTSGKLVRVRTWLLLCARTKDRFAIPRSLFVANRSFVGSVMLCHNLQSHRTYRSAFVLSNAQ